MREASLQRTTAETTIDLKLNLDGTGQAEIHTGVGFMDHMLTLFAVHGMFDLRVACDGDTYVDDHHSVEDIGICLGKAFAQALGDKAGITRYGFMVLPMDEALIQSEARLLSQEQIDAMVAGAQAEAEPEHDAVVLSAIDISGRDCLEYALNIPTEKVGTFDTELVEEFWIAFVRNAGVSLHIRQLAGRNSHHIIEGCFKSVARSLRIAVAIDPLSQGKVPSSKGVL